MDHQTGENETEIAPLPPLTEAEADDRLHELARETSTAVGRAIQGSRDKERASGSLVKEALALIEGRNDEEDFYVVAIVNAATELAKQRLSKTWTAEELVPVEPAPDWDERDTLNLTRTHQQRNAMVTPTPRLLYDVSTAHLETPIILAAKALEPGGGLLLSLSRIGMPRPTKDEVMAKVVDAYAYDMSVYFRRMMMEKK